MARNLRKKSRPDARYVAVISALKAARKSLGLTQRQLANRLGRDQTFVSKFELGERRLDVVELIDICTALEVDPLIIVKKLQRSTSREQRGASRG